MDFDRFSRKIGIFASQTAKKAGDQMQIAKLGMDKAGVEKEIDDVYLAMGRYCYSRYKAENAVSDQIREYCQSVDGFKDQIAAIEAEIAQRKAERDSTEYGTPTGSAPFSDEETEYQQPEQIAQESGKSAESDR